MTIRVRCPGCNNEYALADSQAGKKVRCKKCDAVILVKAAPETDAPSAHPFAAAVASAPPRRNEERPLPAKLPNPPRRARDDDSPPIKKSGGMALWLILGGVGVVLFMLLACGGVATVLMFGLFTGPSPVANVSPTVVVQEAVAPAPDKGPPVAPPVAQPPAVNPPPADNTAFHLGDVRRSVVFIRRSTPGLPTATGSGFFVTADGLIATNRHVVQSEAGPNAATVFFVGVPSAADPDVLDYFKAQVAFCSPVGNTLDFALLKIAARPGYQPFRPLALAPAGARMDLGAQAAVVGFPLVSVDKPVLSFNKGSISATRREFEDHPFYQTDAAVNPGNSGGPLINTDGQAVGIVTLKLDDANNMGYALYLSETGLPGILNQDKVARLQPEAGPLDPKQLPTAGAAKPTRLASWQITHGDAIEEKGLVIADNSGASYWLTNKEPLPENFQLSIECFVAPLRPERPQLPFGPPRGFGPPMPRPPNLPQAPVNLNILRSLYVRFGTDAVEQEISSMSGVTVHLSAAQLQVAENGTVVATDRRPIPNDLFLLTVTRRSDELTIAVNGDVWARQKLQRALQGPHKFSIGGLQSGLILRAAAVAPVDGPPVPPPLAGDPPKPAPTGPPTVLAFDAGWDKPMDADGDCKITPNKGSLTIEVPANKRHDLVLDQGVLNAPRLLRDVTGDFTAQVRVDGDFTPTAPSTSPVGVPFLGAGLVLTAGDQTLLRLERAAVNRGAQTNAYVNWEGRSVGKQNWSNTAALRADEPAVYLRLRRQGDRFFAAFSRDGANWTELPPQDVKLPAGVKVGVVAITTSAGGFKASYDDFRLGASGEAALPPAPPPVDPKIWAAQAPADWKGPVWTTDLDKMKAPDGAPSGWLMGAEFKAEDISYNIGMLNLRQGQPGKPGGNIMLVLAQKTLNDLEGKTITIAGKQPFPNQVFGQTSRTIENNQVKAQPLGDFTLKLEFGKMEDGKLSGAMYLCLPDDSKSVIAGKFVLLKK